MNDCPGTPCGAQVWLDLCRWCGQDPQPYDKLPKNHPTKLSIEHWFSQAMGGDWKVLRNGIMSLYAVEFGFNNSAEFKMADSLAEQTFLGMRTYRNHAKYVNWLHTGHNHKLPSLAFLQSTHCTDTELATPIYLASGMRASGRTRQLFLPFGAAQGLRSAVKRARVEDSGDAQSNEHATVRTLDAGTQTDAEDEHRCTQVRMSKYAAFTELPQIFEKSSIGIGKQRARIPIKCPHCEVVFVKLPATALKYSKAGRCADHLTKCQVYSKVCAAPVPAVQSVATEHDKLRDLDARLQAERASREVERGLFHEERKEFTAERSQFHKERTEFATERGKFEAERKQLQETLDAERAAHLALKLEQASAAAPSRAASSL
jgi:hypothetical protein